MKNEIAKRIMDAMPTASVEVRTDDGVHYEVNVSYEGFGCLPKVKQHRMVYDALGNMFEEGLHALAIHTKVPDQGVDMSIQSRIEQIVTESPIVLFMKGEQHQPMCGFSARVVSVLNHLDIPYKAVNVLDDDQIREGIKIYAEWPTIPQLFVNGTFIGGCDIVCEMYENGELRSLLTQDIVD